MSLGAPISTRAIATTPTPSRSRSRARSTSSTPRACSRWRARATTDPEPRWVRPRASRRRSRWARSGMPNVGLADLVRAAPTRPPRANKVDLLEQQQHEDRRVRARRADDVVAAERRRRSPRRALRYATPIVVRVCGDAHPRAHPSATLDQITAALETSSVTVVDAKNGLSFPRLDCLGGPSVAVAAGPVASGQRLAPARRRARDRGRARAGVDPAPAADARAASVR